ncbi:UNVERIFIED_CONTAM: hypothetical protein Sindi_1863100 [Sesamum indicum]
MVMLPSTDPVSDFVNKGFKKKFLLMTFMQWSFKIGDRKTLEVEASNGFDSVGNVIGLLTRDKEAIGMIDFLARLSSYSSSNCISLVRECSSHLLKMMISSA